MHIIKSKYFKCGQADIAYVEGVPLEKSVGVSWWAMVDKYRQVYMPVDGYLGAGVGLVYQNYWAMETML